MGPEDISMEQHEYTTLVNGNGGEEQTVIVTTTGQSGHVAFRVLHTSVDGGWSREPGVRELASIPWQDNVKTRDRDELARFFIDALSELYDERAIAAIFHFWYNGTCMG